MSESAAGNGAIDQNHSDSGCCIVMDGCPKRRSNIKSNTMQRPRSFAVSTLQNPVTLSYGSTWKTFGLTVASTVNAVTKLVVLYCNYG
eukprot:4717021-Amphidinium_carterae.1